MGPAALTAFRKLGSATYGSASMFRLMWANHILEGRPPLRAMRQPWPPPFGGGQLEGLL